jgi:hypothetical protein
VRVHHFLGDLHEAPAVPRTLSQPLERLVHLEVQADQVLLSYSDPR